MQIYILRHGTAESRKANVPDAGRKLTSGGRSDVRRVLQLAKASGMKPQCILSSALVRAKQTAALAAKLLGVKDLAETGTLLPNAKPEAVWKELGGLRKVDQVLLAGHEPHMSNLVRFLLESPVAVDLKKGALVRIDCENVLGPPRGVLKWMVTPRLVRGS